VIPTTIAIESGSESRRASLSVMRWTIVHRAASSPQAAIFGS
jgi:hypothetical protein